MGRALRITYPGAWYHVMNRGAARQCIFHTDAHRKLFLHLLYEITERFTVEIHAYCLMDNHYHLLLHTPQGNLSQTMRHLNSLYTRRFNIASCRDGPLFRGRFKAKLVDKDNYLLPLSRYIHLNPVAAGLTDIPQAYPWSSYQYYYQKNFLAPKWLFCDEILGHFGPTDNARNYHIFVNQCGDNQIKNFYREKQRMPILGTTAFKDEVSLKYLKNKIISHEISEHKLIIKSQLPSMQNIAQSVANYYDESVEKLKPGIRSRRNTPRLIAIYLSVKVAQCKQAEIAEFFGDITYSAVAKVFHRVEAELKENEQLAKEVENILMCLK